MRVLLLALFVGLGSGCARSPYHEVRGRVTWGGEPLPAGELIFRPDAASGNEGPAFYGEFNDGEYHSPEGLGHVGGPYLVRINGYDGKAGPFDPRGTPIFHGVEFRVTLPAEDATLDFDVPKQTPLPK